MGIACFVGAAPAAAIPGRQMTDTIAIPQGSLSTDGWTPTPVTRPLILIGNTSGRQVPPSQPWRFQIDGSVNGVNTQAQIYCANTPNSDPSIESPGYGGLAVPYKYGKPPIDADGNWTCEVGTDPHAATDGFNMFDPNSPSVFLSPNWSVWDNWGSFYPGGGLGSPTYYLRFVTTLGAPVVSWPIAATATLAGLAGWAWRSRRRVRAGR